MSHSHWHEEGDPRMGRVCPIRTKRECDETYANWQASEQVWLAHRIVAEGRSKAYRRGKDVFSQLVMVIAGDKQDIDGVAPFTERIRAALRRTMEAGKDAS